MTHEGLYADPLCLDHDLPMVTGDAVAHALRKFRLALQGGKDWEWLAMAVRRSLALAEGNKGDGPERTSDADIRDELKRLAGSAESTWLQLVKCDGAARSRLWDFAGKRWDGEGATDIGDGLFIVEPPEYRRFNAALAELDWLSGFLRQAARATKSQRGPWNSSEKKTRRIERGRYLAPVFEAAFGKRVTANNWPSDARNREATPFMKFYDAMVRLAFGGVEATNLSEVVAAACQFHRVNPVLFAEGVIPGLDDVGRISTPPAPR